MPDQILRLTGLSRTEDNYGESRCRPKSTVSIRKRHRFTPYMAHQDKTALILPRLGVPASDSANLAACSTLTSTGIRRTSQMAIVLKSDETMAVSANRLPSSQATT